MTLSFPTRCPSDLRPGHFRNMVVTCFSSQPELLGVVLRMSAQSNTNPKEHTMAHEITATDNLFSVREMPWHGLGTVLSEYPTRDEAKAIAQDRKSTRLNSSH